MKTRIYSPVLAICASAFLVPSATQAQEVVVAEEAATVTEFSCDNVDRYSSSWRDNWFIQVGAGINQPVVERGNGSYNGRPYIDRQLMTPEYNFAVGRWFTPYVGFRLNALGGVLHWDNPTETRPGWTRANHANLNLEFMWDMCNSIAGVNSNRPVSVIPFVGLGGDFMWNMKGLDGGVPVATNIVNDHDKLWRRSWTLPVSAGFQLRFRLCEYVDFFAEARAAFYGDNWNQCAQGRAVDINLSALGGFNFNIGGREWNKYNECASAAEIASLNGQVNNLRAELLAANQALAAAVSQPQENVTNAVVEVDCPEQPLMATVRFKINSSVIEPQEQVNVYNMAQYLKDNPEVNIAVVGFADKDTGSAQYNQALSLRRAQAVADSLVKNYGVAANRIEVKAQGSSEQPYPANNDWNRIVIFVNK